MNIYIQIKAACLSSILSVYRISAYFPVKEWLSDFQKPYITQ